MSVALQSPSEARPRFPVSPDLCLYIALAVFSSVGVLGKRAMLQRLLHVPLPALAVLGVVGLLLPLCSVWALQIRRPAGCCVLAGVLFALFVLFPKTEKLHAMGRGSDQPDCILVASHNIMEGRWPYRSVELWSGHPLSCGPGWVMLQAPSVHWLGYPATAALLWILAIASITLAAGFEAAMGVLVLLGLAPSTWLATVNGTDFLPFGLMLAALTAAAARWGDSRAGKALVALVAGMVCDFRVTTLALPGLLTNSVGGVAASLSFLLAIAVQLFFIFWNPAAIVSDGPLHVFSKAMVLVGAKAGGTWLQTPTGLSLLVAAPSLLVFLAIRYLLQYRDGKTVSQLMLSILFVAPALLDLRQKFLMGTGAVNALQFWEGGIWMTACLPTFALFAMRDRVPGEAEETPPA